MYWSSNQTHAHTDDVLITIKCCKATDPHYRFDCWGLEKQMGAEHFLSMSMSAQNTFSTQIKQFLNILFARTLFVIGSFDYDVVENIYTLGQNGEVQEWAGIPLMSENLKTICT